jgi:SET domain-containing protein
MTIQVYKLVLMPDIFSWRQNTISQVSHCYLCKFCTKSQTATGVTTIPDEDIHKFLSSHRCYNQYHVSLEATIYCEL